MPRIHGVREMDVVQCLPAPDQTDPTENIRRDGVGDAALFTTLQRALDPLGEVPRADARLLALRVDGHDASGAVADQVDDGVRHLQVPAVPLRLAEHRNGETG